MHHCQIDAARRAAALAVTPDVRAISRPHVETCSKAGTIAQCASRTTMISAPATGGDNMAEQQITPGTKLQVAFDVPMGQKTDFNMLATYKDTLDEAYFLMSAPMLAGKPLLMDENQKLLLQYKVGEETFVIAGYPESVEKKGIRTYWKMRKVTEQRSFVKRRDERFKVAMRLTYQRDNAPTPEPEDAMTIDVSAGGLAIYLNDYPDVGEALAVQMPSIRLQGERRAPKGSLYRNVCGLQFRYADDMERELVKEYVGYVRTKYKL